MTQTVEVGQIYTNKIDRVVVQRGDKTPQATWVKLNNGKTYGKEVFLKIYKLEKV